MAVQRGLPLRPVSLPFISSLLLCPHTHTHTHMRERNNVSPGHKCCISFCLWRFLWSAPTHVRLPECLQVAFVRVSDQFERRLVIVAEKHKRPGHKRWLAPIYRPIFQFSGSALHSVHSLPLIFLPSQHFVILVDRE